MPDEKTTKSLVCPECGRVLAGQDVYAHALTHWPEYLDPGKSSREARNRQKALLNGGITLEAYEASHREA